MDRMLPTSVLMSIASRHAEGRVIEAVRAAGFDGLTVAQARLLAGMQDGGSRISTLADRAQVTKQTATVLVDRLEAAGYVARTVDPTDGRGRLVQFTDRALAMLSAARAEEQRIEREWAECLGQRHYSALAGALEKLRKVTDRQV